MTATSAYIVSVIHSIDVIVNIMFGVLLGFTLLCVWITAGEPEKEREMSIAYLKRCFVYLLCLVVLMCLIPDKKTMNLMFDVPAQCSEIAK